MIDLSSEKGAHVDERLRTDLILWLGTVRPDGRPHLVPVWFLWDGSTILLFSIPENQKVRNLRQNNRVMAALDDTYDGDDVVTLEGTAELLDDPNVKPTTVADYVAKYANELAEMGMSPERLAAEYSQAIRITPTRFY
ncbi:MAG TPA: TIGR03667 family PPOX class F420-dependent oxidoreductase [Ktedonobacterales bacterium]|jgi:PPOX class probable F420-dependent enzyme|nr:TIGR03667 family PPOX class F420-dependent oxidoreductase [Ktedonobacterales bacterium]